MDTLVGSLTALISILILAVSLGAIAVVTTGAALPQPRRRPSRPPAQLVAALPPAPVNPASEEPVQASPVANAEIVTPPPDQAAPDSAPAPDETERT